VATRPQQAQHLPVALLCCALGTTLYGQPARALLTTNTAGFGNPVVSNNFNPIPVNTRSGGPLTFLTPNNHEVIFTSTNPNAVINYSGSYSFGSNYGWNNLPMAGTDDSIPSIDFTFKGFQVKAAGGFLNYSPDIPDLMTISALDVNGNILETHNLTFSISGSNQGATYYIQRPQADIATLRIAENFAALAYFTYDAPPVPGPLPLLGASIAFLHSRKLRKRIQG
jgi:hypothetical protein